MTYEYPIQRTSGIVAEDLGKQFGDLWALRELDLDVPAGTVLGLLGHNGAGLDERKLPQAQFFRSSHARHRDCILGRDFDRVSL